jgi:Dihydrodipicolinate reductase
MAKIKIAVAGCLGRMGHEISKEIIQHKNLEFVGGFEHKKHKDINRPLNKVSDIQSSKLVSTNSTPLIKESKCHN